MAEANAFGLPNGEPIASVWSRVIRNQKVALRKLLDNARFKNATIVSPGVDQAMRVWRQDLDAFTDELTGRMLPYMTTVLTRSGNKIRSRMGLQKADDWFIRDQGRVQAIESTVLDLCKDTLDVIGLDAAAKVATIRAELIAGEIDDGTGGWKDLYTSLDKFFDESAKWRAARIARTEASRAANWGIRAAAEEIDDLIGFEWLMAPGACQACQLVGKTLDGQPRRVTKGNPFATDVGPKITNADDPERRRVIPEEYRQIRFAPLHPHCVLADTPVRMASLVTGTQAKYHGPVVRLVFSDGSRVAVTPNHMLLTPTGFARASDLMKGDDVLRTGLGELEFSLPTSYGPHVDGDPVLAKDVIRAMTEPGCMTSSGVPVSPEQLHGDAAFVDGNIHVVWADGLLRRGFNPKFGKPVEHGGFIDRIKPTARFAGQGDLASCLEALRLATDGGVSSLRETKAFLWGRFRHPFDHSLRSIPGGPTHFFQPAHNTGAADAQSIRNALHGFSGVVQTAKVVEINFDPSRHETHSVYDFETIESMYIVGNGIISSNCRCSLKPIFASLHGTQYRFDTPFAAGSRYIPNTAEIDPIDLAA